MAKDALINGSYDRVADLLLPLTTHENREVAGTACYIGGLSFMSQGNRKKACELFQIGVDIGHTDSELYTGYGATLQNSGEYDAAEAVYRSGIRSCGRTASLLSHLATIETLRGNIAEAESLLKESLNLDGESYMGWTNLGNLYQQRGHYRDAIESYKQALKINPGFESAISNLLLTTNYTRVDKGEVFQAHKIYALQVAPVQLPPQPQRKPGDRVRIGYLSGDFKTHSVAYFFAPLLDGHDRGRFEIFCYSDVYSPDSVTKRFEEGADHWRQTASLSNEEVGELIRRDGIDILVDLAGHAGGKRIALFRGKPAPAAVTYLGYPNTLGLPEVQYRIVDSVTDPRGESDHFHTEKLMRVDGSFLSYMLSSEIPEVAPLPAVKNEFVTFGSFNNLVKLSDETVEIWGKLLNAVPDSRLFLKSKPLKDESIREAILLRFEAVGVDRDRIRLEAHRPSNRSHLDGYNEIDIALDCFPYNGTTTTCEALAMGVPVLTICGDRHAARVSTSLLTSLGLQKFSAESPEAFVRIGKALAEDIPLLIELRATLRSIVKQSELCDGKRLAGEIERIYLEIFRTVQER